MNVTFDKKIQKEQRAAGSRMSTVVAYYSSLCGIPCSYALIWTFYLSIVAR